MYWEKIKMSCNHFLSFNRLKHYPIDSIVKVCTKILIEKLLTVVSLQYLVKQSILSLTITTLKVFIFEVPPRPPPPPHKGGGQN